MSVGVVNNCSLSPPCTDTDKQDRPASLSFPPGNSPSHYHDNQNHHGNNPSVANGDSHSIQSDSHSPSSSDETRTSTDAGDSPEFQVDVSVARSNFQRGGVVSMPLPPPTNGIYKMSLRAKLPKLLTTIATRDKFYSGLDDTNDGSPCVPGGYVSLGEGPGSFHPFDVLTGGKFIPHLGSMAASADSPFYHMSHLANDGTTPEGFPRKRGGVWTLNLVDGNLFLFKTSANSEQPLKEEEDDEKREDEEEEVDMMEGIELAKLLSKTPSPSVVAESSANYYHLPATVVYAEVDNPHVSPVYAPLTGSKYRLSRRHDSEKMTPTEYILHRNKVFLVLDETHVPPVINAVTQDDMITTLEKLSDEGNSFPDASFNPVVNIKFEAGHSRSATHPNNIAIYFTGKHNKFRYYVQVNDQGCLVPLKEALPLPRDDWKKYLEFSNSYFTPPRGSEMDRGLGSISERDNEN